MIRRAALVLSGVLLIPVPIVGQQVTAAERQETAAVAEHAVRPGETLWSIARAYYNDPYQWRRILDANQDRISNAREIEPGVMLRIPAPEPGAAVPQTVAETQGVAEVRGVADLQSIRVTTVPRRFGSPMIPTPEDPLPDRTVFYMGGGGQQVGLAPTPDAQPNESPPSRVVERAVALPAIAPDVFYTAGWLIPIDTEPKKVATLSAFAARDGGRIFDRTTAYPFDRLRLALSDGPQPEVGEQLMTYRLGREIEFVGQVVQPTGIITVTDRQASGVIAVLAQEYGQVSLGDGVIRMPPFPLAAGATAKPATSDRVGSIIAFADSHLVQSLGSIVFFEFGSDPDVGVGDEFVVQVGEGQGWDGDAIGRLQVVGVYDDHLVARIIQISAPLFTEGLPVRLIARMP